MFGLFGIKLAASILSNTVGDQERQARAAQDYWAAHLVARKAAEEAAIHAARNGTTIDGECIEVVPPRLIGHDAS